MSRFTRFSRGKIWLVDIGLCKRFDIFQLWIYFAKYSAAAGAGGAWSQCLATAQCHLGFPTLSLCKRYKCNNQIEEKYLTKRRLADEDNGRRCKRGEVITREPGGGISWENLSVYLLCLHGSLTYLLHQLQPHRLTSKPICFDLVVLVNVFLI